MGMSVNKYYLPIIFTFLSILRAEQTLGRSTKHRIISGHAAADGQFPWQVILKKDQLDDLLCGGSIIHSDWVLTAAHCTYGLSSIYMIFGTVFLNNPKALSMTSTDYFVHSDYNAETLSNDISLIRLPKSLEFTRSIQPILLVPSSEETNNFLGYSAVISGFGLIDDENLEFSNQLLYAQVTIINNSQCEAIFGAEIVSSSTMCANGANDSNQSICSGDSGGPLITSDSSGNYMQIAINSFVAQDACSEGLPSGYVRLTAYLSFISQTTGLIIN